MDGLITSTKLALSPLHSPLTPSSPSITSRAVSMMPFLSSLLCVCCRVVMTATGMVKSCASAPAKAPRDNSTTVDGCPAALAYLR
jgi:hypothetical protein